MIPNIDSQIGMDVYSTSFEGIGGKIRANPEDFVVSEIITKKSFDSISYIGIGSNGREAGRIRRYGDTRYGS